nr:retrotransposon protein, putative, Ty1-copia subclass [Tanacetum cinerariifolium]
MVPTKKVEKTPYKVWHGQAPKLSYLKVWGYEEFVKRDTLTKPDKLDPKSFKYLKASGGVEDLELIQEEDTNPSVDTSLNHEEDDQEIDEPQSDINPIRRSTRTCRPTYRLCLYIDAEKHELGDLEMQSMKYNDVLVLVKLPPNARTDGSKWLFKKKNDMDGVVYIFKARLVAKGFTQTYGVNYEETFSPVTDIRSIRILIAIAAYYDYKIWQMDVKTAFLNGHLSEEVYIEQPEGFVNPKYPNHHMQNVPYASAIGSIMYAVRCTRPDVAFAQNIKSQFQQDPGNMERELRVSCYTDAGYLTDADNLKSYTGYVFVLNGGDKAVWIRKFIFGLGIVPTIEEPISMHCDNTIAIAIAKDDGVTKGTRHFREKVHYLRETIKLGDVKIEKIDTVQIVSAVQIVSTASIRVNTVSSKLQRIYAKGLLLLVEDLMLLVQVKAVR